MAYTTIMKSRPHTFAYMDGFAGTGYHELKQEEQDSGPSLFQAEDEPEIQAFMDGSARIALQVDPRFHKYIFIEKCPKKTVELQKLRTEFPDKGNDIVIHKKDANDCLQDLCGRSWEKKRAVLFIDPFGMQLTWDTLKAVARTQAIDTWILFPVSAVNRLLTQKRPIPESWQKRLDTMFGEHDWYSAFFKKLKTSLFEDGESTHKTADMDSIGKYFNKRLASIFAGVASNPYTLCNKKRAPLFLLCFAAANPNAVKPALRIAQDILKRPPTNKSLVPLQDE